MTKFAVTHVKGDKETIVEIFDSREQAIEASHSYREKYRNAGGLICCIEAMFDDHKQFMGNSIRLHTVYSLCG